MNDADQAPEAEVPHDADEALSDGVSDPAELRDELPDDLDPTFAPPYEIPDNKRRRIPGYLYLGIGAVILILVIVRGGDGVFVNTGLGIAAAGLMLFGLFHLLAAQPLGVDENDALVVATRTVGFPVGHASAQLAWRGFRSRPTWRMLIFSPEDPPRTRAFVLVDGVDGSVVDHIVEANTD